MEAGDREKIPMQRIGSKQICLTLMLDWIGIKEDYIPLRYDDFKKKMMESGLIASASTIKNKWTRLGGLECFVPQSNPNLYAVDLRTLKARLGYTGLFKDKNVSDENVPDEIDDEAILWEDD